MVSLSDLRGFRADELSDQRVEAIERLAARSRADALEMITQAGSGHPGGSLSSLDIYLVLWLCARVSPQSMDDAERDRIVVSHGHTAAGLYAVLGNLGFFDVADCKSGFRRLGSPFEGHPCLRVPGVEWGSGSLGQGLSVGCGFALAARLRGLNYHVFVVMGDGEQAKGQVHEARKFAAKYKLANLTVIVDCNGLQASGRVEDVMPQNIGGEYAACGWRVMEADGHNYRELCHTLREAYLEPSVPCVILARTTMGKGVPFIEGRHEYHGQPLTRDQCARAVATLRCQNEYGPPATETNAAWATLHHVPVYRPAERKVQRGAPIIYAEGEWVECRTAFGEALCDLAAKNPEALIVALDCDLADSVRLSKFGRLFPGRLIECGIQEHNAATVAAALSRSGIITFLAGFGVFAIDETYGQHRMADMNGTSLKLICTHCGLDVGEDGKTHQCVDYISLLSNLWGFRLLIPADANQTDHMVRYAATTPGNIAVAMGRSKVPVLTDEEGKVLFGRDYSFRYGAADWIRHGKHGTIVCCGSTVWRAVKAHDELRTRGFDVGVLSVCCPGQLDEDKIREAVQTGLVVTYEDHHVQTGLGSLVGTYLAEHGLVCRFVRRGLTEYGASATPDCLYQMQGLDEHSLAEAIAGELQRQLTSDC